MIGSVPANRRANAFAQVLDESPLDESRLGDEEAGDASGARREGPGDAPEQDALLAVVHQLTALPRPSLSAETRAAQRARLLAEVETAPCPATDVVPEQRRRGSGRGAHRAAPVGVLARLRPRTRLTKGLAAGGLTMGVAAGALGGVAAASSDALPGDTLYGLKRGMEDLQLDFASGDVDRGRVYLDHAATRLHEALRLMERGRAGTLDQEQLDEVRHALTSMRDDAAEAHRLLSQAYEAEGSLDPMRSLSDFTEDHRGTWAQLRQQLPPELRDISADVSGVFDAIDEEIAPIQPLLPTEPETTASTSDEAPSHEESASRDAGATPTPSAEPSSAPASTGSSGSTASPEPTGESEGLLEGSGLLDPESGTGEAGSSPSAEETSPSSGGLTEPEVTIPPLVEDLLPGLGLDVQGEGQ
ncbi:DUF5667 domain-containing protein [Streptomyces sp. B6B3]|uniref:DUF5667 domain-containing protein n=1 Tax=Streptomyces sp. B6B3 TaxID=3153570 RepID=UPI00325DDBAE